MIRNLILLVSFNFSVVHLSAQNNIAASATGADSVNKLLTIVYNITVKTDKHKAGIEETYNGGIQTVFINNNKARIRLVSLMRIQSIFFSSYDKQDETVSIVKESGKKRYKCPLTDKEWALYNDKYKDDSCQLTGDSLVVLKYNCRKAIIILKNGKEITAYYTNELKPISSKIEPAFDKVPGLVLQYEYEYKDGTMTYTANKISQNPITTSIFKVPSKGYPTRNYRAGSSSFNVNEVSLNQ